MKIKKHNILRRYFLPLLLSVCTAVSFPSSVFAYGEEAVVPDTAQESFEYPVGGVEDIQLFPLTEEEAEEVRRVAELNREAALTEQLPRRYESGYSTASSYYYDNMNNAEKALYNKIVNSCEDILNSSANITNSSNGKYYTDYISLNTPLSAESVRNLVRSVYYSNPQYFFLDNGWSCSTSGGLVTSVAITLRSEYISGSARMNANLQIQAVTNEWMDQINKLESDLEKEKWIVQKLCETITYKSSAYDQTIAGALIYQKCVCNGYAMAMTYFCNAAGIDCMTVLGNNHAWNIVRINGVWYETDVTWMDQTAAPSVYIYTIWFNKSRSTFLNNDDDRMGHHIDTDRHTGIMSIPDCTSDYPSCKEHAWGKSIVTRQPTASEKGYQFHWCSVCSDGEIAVICPSRYHKYSYNEYEFDGSSHWQVCIVCQTAGEKKAHTFSGDTCTVCGYSASIGDVNGDGEFTIMDIVILANAYRSNNADQYVASADMDGSGTITIIDIVKLCNLYRGK